MKGDFTRNTFKKDNHYTSVRMQQGRVLLDADWNEQVDIQNNRVEIESIDTIGITGAPKENAGFRLEVEDGEIWILDGRANKADNPKIGRYYVDGMLCEIEDAYQYEDQPNFHGEALPQDSENAGLYLAYLDVWQRHITPVEDP